MSGPDDDSKAEDFRRPFSDSDTEECSHTIQTLLAEAAQTMEKASNIALDEFDLDCSHGEATSRAVMPRSRERLAAEAKGLEALDEALVHLATRLGRRRTTCGACIAAGSDDGSIAEGHNQVSSGSAAHSAQPKTLKGVVRHHIEENLLVLYEVPCSSFTRWMRAARANSLLTLPILRAGQLIKNRCPRSGSTTRTHWKSTKWTGLT